MERNEIVEALRCRANDDSGCSGECPYLLTEPISEDLAEFLGIKSGEVRRSCNVDQIMLDAANMIEKQTVLLQKQTVLLQKQAVLLQKLWGAARIMKEAISELEQDLRCAVSGQDGCQFCAHFCNDGKPVYRPDEGYLAYCEKCDGDCCCFEWRGIQGTEELK